MRCNPHWRPTCVLALMVMVVVVIDQWTTVSEHLALAAVAVVVELGAWTLELGGVRWLRLVFIAAVLAPIIVFTDVLTMGGLAPLLPLLLVTWVSYRGTRIESLAALVLSLATLLTFDPSPHTLIPWSVGVVGFWLLAQLMVVQQRLVLESRAANGVFETSMPPVGVLDAVQSGITRAPQLAIDSPATGPRSRLARRGALACH